MQTILMVLVIVVLMAPLLLVYAIPFIVPAIVFHSYTALWLGERTRLVLASGIASLGIAPAFDQFWAPKSMYLRLLEGDPVDPMAALASFAVTWVIVALAAAQFARLRSRRYA